MQKCDFNFIEITLLNRCSCGKFVVNTVSNCGKFIVNTVSNCILDFRFVAKDQFSETVVIVDKTRKMGVHIHLWYLNSNLEFNIRLAA